MKLVTNLLKDKKIRYGGYAALLTLLVLLGLVVLNLLVQQVPAEIDLTENKLFSLSEQTETLLESLEEPVNIYALYAAGEEETNIAEILRKYEQASRLVSVEFIDPELNPGFITRYDEEGDGISAGSVIVEQGELFRVIANMELYNISYSQQGQPQLMGLQVEPKVTQAINYVSSGYTPKLYQLTGHGEYTLDEYGITPALEGENYEIESLDLITAPEVPEDAAVLLIMSPKFPISEEELDKIHAYIDEGGRALVLADFIGEPSPGANAILRSYGLEILPGLIMENDKRRYAGNQLFAAPFLLEHEILEPLKENDLNLITPIAVALQELERKPRSIELTPLLASSDQSWRRLDPTSDSALQLESDVLGPYTIAWAVERQQYNDDEPEAFRLVAMGNSQFLGQIPPYGQIKGNIDYFLNSLAWLNERSETITIRSKSLFRLPMRLNALQSIIYAGIVVILIPAGLLVAGLVVWLRRRHL